MSNEVKTCINLMLNDGLNNIENCKLKVMSDILNEICLKAGVREYANSKNKELLDIIRLKSLKREMPVKQLKENIIILKEGLLSYCK